MIGGTTSVLAGDKFQNGAVTAAFAYLFNEAAGDAGQYVTDSDCSMPGSASCGTILIPIFNPVAFVRGLIQGIPQAFAPSTIRFGANEAQRDHAFRHVDGIGLNRTQIENAIRNDLRPIARSMSDGLYKGSTSVNGIRIDYHAYKLSDGTINVGRITPPSPQ
ncbi:MAG: hypothetical protein HY057_07425 [Rhodospirillales bacterium]|nr:hypothetical protein [Rhodospirillales bacterium]